MMLLRIKPFGFVVPRCSPPPLPVEVLPVIVTFVNSSSAPFELIAPPPPVVLLVLPESVELKLMPNRLAA
jgi:hypothetical protein